MLIRFESESGEGICQFRRAFTADRAALAALGVFFRFILGTGTGEVGNLWSAIKCKQWALRLAACRKRHKGESPMNGLGGMFPIHAELVLYARILPFFLGMNLGVQPPYLLSLNVLTGYLGKRLSRYSACPWCVLRISAVTRD